MISTRRGILRLSVIAAVLLGAAVAPGPSVPPRGSIAPPISLEALDGTQVQTAGLAGRTVVLVFGDLLHEGARRTAAEVLDVLEDDRLAHQEIVPIFLTAQAGSTDSLRSQAASGRFPAIVLQDAERAAFGSYEIVVIPSVVVVNGGGTVVYAAAGFLPRFRELLTEALLVSTGQAPEAEFERLLGAARAPEPDENTLRAERLVHLAEQLAAHDLNEMAEARCREALALAPDYLPARMALGEMLRRRGRLDEAEAHFRGLASGDETLVDARLGLARVLIDRGSDALDEAESLVRRVLGSDVRSPRAHFLLGLILESRGDCAGAASSFRKSAELLLER